MDDAASEERAREAARALARACAHPVKLGIATPPHRPGLYAIHAAAVVWLELELGEPPDDRPLYVGKSESSLAGRDVSTHFGYVGAERATSVTGYSTLRRSLAALLRDRRGFRGVPRNSARRGNFSNYGLLPDQDEDLSSWMRQHLRLACWASPEEFTIEELRRVERDVLVLLLPPLNLKGIVTPWKQQVETARKVLTAEARAAAL